MLLYSSQRFPRFPNLSRCEMERGEIWINSLRINGWGLGPGWYAYINIYIYNYTYIYIYATGVWLDPTYKTILIPSKVCKRQIFSPDFLPTPGVFPKECNCGSFASQHQAVPWTRRWMPIDTPWKMNGWNHKNGGLVQMIFLFNWWFLWFQPLVFGGGPTTMSKPTTWMNPSLFCQTPFGSKNVFLGKKSVELKIDMFYLAGA